MLFIVVFSQNSIGLLVLQFFKKTIITSFRNGAKFKYKAIIIGLSNLSYYIQLNTKKIKQTAERYVMLFHFRGD